MIPQLFEHHRVAAVGILTDLEQTYCYLMFPSHFQDQISLTFPMFAKGLPDPPQLISAFPTLNDMSQKIVSLPMNDCLTTERCQLDLRLTKSIACVANLLLASLKLPIMESKYAHLALSFFPEGNPTINILPLRDFQVLETFYGRNSVCYHMLSNQSDGPKSFALKQFHSDKDGPMAELELWRSVYGLSADQVVLVANDKTRVDGLLIPWFELASETLQNDPQFVVKVKKLCSEIAQKNEKWIHGDIRWPNIGCFVVKTEGKEDEYLPVMLDLDSLLMGKVEFDFNDIRIPTEHESDNKAADEPILPRLELYFKRLESLRPTGLCVGVN